MAHRMLIKCPLRLWTPQVIVKHVPEVRPPKQIVPAQGGEEEVLAK